MNIPFAFEADAELLRLLPEYFREIPDFAALMETEEEEFRKFYGAAVEVLCDFFVQTCGAARLSEWESALGIETDGTESEEYRRYKILSYMGRNLPYTLATLKMFLNTSLGVGAWSLYIDYASYTLKIYANTKAPRDALNIIKSIFVDVIPAHYDTIDGYDIGSTTLYRGIVADYYARTALGTPTLSVNSDTN
jgi:hypothetical protein